MHIVIPDDYRGRVRQLPCLTMLAAHRVTVFCTPARGPDELASRLADADVVVTLSDWLEFSPALLERLPQLRLIFPILRSSLFIDIEACVHHGVLVAAGENCWREACAELTMALILGSRDDLVFRANLVRRGEWPCPLSHRLYGRTLGILGCGRVGSLVSRAAHGLGMNILVWGREQSFSTARACGYDLAASKAQLFEQADVLSVHVPINPETLRIVVAAELARMKPSSLLVNTSGAPLINPRTLLGALHQGRPGFAAFSIDHDYPLGPDDQALLQSPKVLCVPDTGWREADRLEVAVRECFEAILDYANGANVRALVPAPRTVARAA